MSELINCYECRRPFEVMWSAWDKKYPVNTFPHNSVRYCCSWECAAEARAKEMIKFKQNQVLDMQLKQGVKKCPHCGRLV